jgi:hypothetical protein
MIMTLSSVEYYLDEEDNKHEFLAPTLLNKMGWPKGII